MAAQKRTYAKLPPTPEVITEVWKDIRQLRENSSVEHAAVNARIDRVNTVLTEKFTEIDEKRDAQTEKLTKHIDSLVDKLGMEVQTAVTGLASRLQILEKWKWTIVGGSFVVALIVADVVARVLTESGFIKQIFNLVN